ncbi:uncharacterized protein DFL_001448 [Arthrobotrys flagrans]|uniref:Beta-lactamase-related domain-containing protein n=1 Tax=Arthrobotrys flagrans TaxID=97331 RepID=A0A437A7N4_ARTFL|nr:hypothetical protein DFL_001448 [Arthrobotrys flagrans]
MESRPLLNEKLTTMTEEVEVDVKKKSGKKWLMNTCWTAIGFSVGMFLTLYVVKDTPNPSIPPLQRRQTPNLYSGNTILASDSSPILNSPQWRCVPPPPPFLLDDPRVIQHPAVKLALAQLELTLKADTFSSKDALSISIVHSSKGKIYEFHHGRKRLNESAHVSPAKVDGNSIYRIASVSKVFAVLEALVLSRQAQLKKFVPELTLESRLQDVLPEFKLPRKFKDEAGDITLGQLGSHRAGIGRDMGEMIINSTADIIWPPVPGQDTFIEKYYQHNTSPRELLNTVSKNDLIWQVGETPSYSNTGFSILGLATGNYRKKLKKETKSWASSIKKDIFDPLNMGHTFAGAIPCALRKDIVTPNSRNMVDLTVPAVHDPAGGIFSTTNDLATFLRKILLSRSPLLISPSQRLNWLRSIHYNTDAITSVGIPWESYRAIMPDYAAYNIYFKGGGLPGQLSQISAFPEFGYGVTVLTSLGSTDSELVAGAATTDPLALSFTIHNTLAPAIWKAYNSIVTDDYVGTYTSPDGIARIAFENEILTLKELKIHGVDALSKADQLIWRQGGKQVSIFGYGAGLIGTGFEGKFRAAPLFTCVWSGFDIATTKSGWGLDLFVFKKVNGKMTLFYEPMRGKLVKQ